MNTIDCIRERRSVRSFKPEKLEHSIIESVISAAAFAPSWKNTQITRYIVIEDQELKSRIGALASDSNKLIIEHAPAIAAVTFIKNRSGFERDGSFTTGRKGEWQMFDAGIASQTFCLAAHELGLGTVIMGIFDGPEITKLLELPEDRELAALIAIGYPESIPAAPKRKTVEDLLTYK